MSQLISEGYVNKPYIIDALKCTSCEAVANYVESDINIHIGPCNKGGDCLKYRVLCKGGCNRAIVISKSLPIIVHNRIMNKIDRLHISCIKCGKYSVKATTGKFTIISEYFIFNKEVIYYMASCGHIFYLDKDKYPIITNYVASKVVDDRLNLTL